MVKMTMQFQFDVPLSYPAHRVYCSLKFPSSVTHQEWGSWVVEYDPELTRVIGNPLRLAWLGLRPFPMGWMSWP